MRRSLLKGMCVVVLLCVCWIVVHPAFDVEPTAFRSAVFAAIVLLVLRCAFKFARPVIFTPAWSLGSLIAETSPEEPSTISLAPLRC
jgi:hypothetical protein